MHKRDKFGLTARRKKTMDRTYSRLLFAQKRYEVFAILSNIREDQMKNYLYDKNLERWKCEMIKQFLKKKNE